MIIENIQKLIDSDITAYKIAKDLGISPTLIQKYKTGEQKVENMTLKLAVRLNEFYLKNFNKKS